MITYESPRGTQARGTQARGTQAPGTQAPGTHRDCLGTHSPWRQLNLVRNPFGECTREERAQLAILPEFDCDVWLAQSAEPFTAIEFLGRCGRGKTTRLLKLHELAKNSYYVYVGEDRMIPTLPYAQPLMIDEAQRLPRKARNRIFHSGVPLILGTHRSLARSLRRNGYRVVSYRIGSQNDAGLLFEFVNRRLEAARYRPGALPMLSRTQADQLTRKFGTNIRAVESFLYDHMQWLLHSQTLLDSQTGPLFDGKMSTHDHS